MAINALILDFETTGIEPESSYILEVGYIAVSINKTSFTVVKEDSFLIKHHVPASQLPMNEFVKKMHTSNGLIAEIDKGGDHVISITEAESKIIDSLKDGFGESVTGFRLSGNSISFDRSYIKTYMLSLERMLHYRMFDTSNYFEIKRELGKSTPIPRLNAHRALSDCRMSLGALYEMFKDLNY
jgi:oligoribonuclease